jgi:hypothetical protein
MTDHTSLHFFQSGIQYNHIHTQWGEAMPAPEIQSTDREIDMLVYELYGLTEDEIKIVGDE